MAILKIIFIVGMCVCHDTHVEGRGRLHGVALPLPSVAGIELKLSVP